MIRSHALLIGLAVLSCFGCRPERHWEHQLEPYPLEVPWYFSSYLGKELDEPTRATVRLGRHLFHDRLLSVDRSVSCASCHLQENAFSDPRPFSEGVNNGVGDRNAMAIINLAFDEDFFWDGRRHSLVAQAHDPVVHPLEMGNDWEEVESRLRDHDHYPRMFFEAFGNLDIDSNQVTQAIAAFETTLISTSSPFDAYFYEGSMDALDSAALRGFDLFFGEAECIHCHAGPLLTDQTFKSNGLDSEVTDPGLGGVTGLDADLAKFKVPTLRNIAQSAPYMHDGRFATLMEVVEHYDSGVHADAPNLDPDMVIYTEGLGLSASQKADLVAFMESFSDPAFLTNPAFRRP